MKLGLLAILSVTAALAGCASSGSASLAGKRSPWAVDAAYVARVESVARQRGVEVKWVNPPRAQDRKVAQR